MKVSELISELQKLDGELNVYVTGYEGGVDDLVTVGAEVEVALDVNKEWDYGEHEVCDEDMRYENYKKAKGVIL